MVTRHDGLTGAPYPPEQDEEPAEVGEGEEDPPQHGVGGAGDAPTPPAGEVQ